MSIRPVLEAGTLLRQGIEPRLVSRPGQELAEVARAGTAYDPDMSNAACIDAKSESDKGQTTEDRMPR